MRRIVAGAATAGIVAAGTAAGQVWLARQARILVPDQAYNAGNDTWPFQLLLIVWCSASAVVIGTAVAHPIVGRTRWRYVLPIAAGLGAFAPLGPVTGWASGASAVGADPQLAAAAAIVCGGLVGMAAAVPALVWRGIDRSATVWVAWIWLATAAESLTSGHHGAGQDSVVPVHPLGMFTPTLPGHENLTSVVGLLSTIPPALLISWWAAHRDERPVLPEALYGPLLLITVHLVVPSIGGGTSDGDHYSLAADRSAWLIAAILVAATGALGILAGRRRTPSARR